MLTWAIQGVQPKPTKFSRIRHALTCFINVFLPVGKQLVGFHCVSWVRAALGPLFTSCLWSPLLSPDSFWVGKFHAWFCQPTSCCLKTQDVVFSCRLRAFYSAHVSHSLMASKTLSLVVSFERIHLGPPWPATLTDPGVHCTCTY